MCVYSQLWFDVDILLFLSQTVHYGFVYFQSEYQTSYEERISLLEEENDRKQDKIRQLENQILTLQVGIGNNNIVAFIAAEF